MFIRSVFGEFGAFVNQAFPPKNRDRLTNALKYLSLRAPEGCVAIRHAVSLRGEAEAIPEIPRGVYTEPSECARNDPSTRLRAGLSGQIASRRSQ